MAYFISGAPAQNAYLDAGGTATRRGHQATVFASALLATLFLSFLTVFVVEWISRGSLPEALSYFATFAQPSWTTVGVVFLAYLAGDALLGREHKAILIFAPLLVGMAVVNSQKQLYLSDPFYPSDMLFGRQIMELMPALVSDRPLTAILLAVGTIVVAAAVIGSWIFAWRTFPRLSARQRILRLAVALPLIAGFAHMMDYSKFFWLRDRLQAVPMMWDQKENYKHNGFILAFLFNVPMAHVAAPAGYGPDAIGAIQKEPVGLAVPANYRQKPDVIVLMSESFWDPTRLPNVKLSPDPMPFIRSIQGGHVFSPEFGGMTPNIEFEALTGFSNAFLPWGSIPYQQYVRRPLPSLATFFKSEGYTTRAIHPFQEWFWNRSNVYKDFGFDEFMSEDKMPPMEKRGIFASDESLMKEIMREADEVEEPFFFFAVTLQGHGPYEPHRYKVNTISVDGNIPEDDRERIATYAQGVKEADDSLKRLTEWAKTRDRETIIVLFGDHLPPLGTAYVSGGYMEQQTALRRAPADQMKREHETPLLIWSSKTGPVKDIGTISPALLPYRILKLAGMEHPYYTGFLGDVSKHYDILDRYMLEQASGKDVSGWQQKKGVAPLIRDYRFLQHDIMFGKEYGLKRFFPERGGAIDIGT
ncbi:LTA synthase family protein [Rhizobium sp. PAMB 3182]